VKITHVSSEQLKNLTDKEQMNKNDASFLRVSREDTPVKVGRK
jgi:hypothetical protein